MRIGIDFGTTRIVAAAEDRGNFPVALFESPESTLHEYIPSLAAARGGARFYGWQAWGAQGTPGVTVLRSVKRMLSSSGQATLARAGTQSIPVSMLLEEMLSSVRQELEGNSSLGVKPGEPLEVVAGVPANANSNQRFLTAEAFRSAGFRLISILNEPSAASLEFAHRASLDTASSSGLVLVYDLGGGTFDVSMVQFEPGSREVVATESIPSLGGDDFDEIMAAMALEAAGKASEWESLDPGEEFTLLEECRLRKESLHPNTRRIVVDLECVPEGYGQVSLDTADYYEQCRPLVEETIDATSEVLAQADAAGAVTLYVTGGGSELPLVGRMLREAFGRRVKRSAYTRSATAIGLAIQASSRRGNVLKEKFTRHFGVWRESEAGAGAVFDTLFEKGLPLPEAGAAPIERVRRYQPAHNIGHFRYMECSRMDASAEPAGELCSWDEIRFPFDASLNEEPSLEKVRVERARAMESSMAEERYTAHSDGTVEVTVSNLSAGYSRSYKLGRWLGEPAHAARRRRPAGKGKP